MVRIAVLLFASLFMALDIAAAQEKQQLLTFHDYVEKASEFSSRARANVYFVNPQSIFRGVQLNFVNVGEGNLTFLRRDMVASGRIPVILARVYDSSSNGTADFGPGWRLSAAETISLEKGTLRLTGENGSLVDWVKNRDNSFQLEKDYPSDYLSVTQSAQDTILAVLRTGLEKEFRQIQGQFRLIRVSDRNGNALQFSYVQGLLSRVQNANHFIAFTRNKTGRIIQARDDQGRTVSYGYDKQGRLVETDDLGGHAWQYSYGDDNKLKKAFDPLQRLNFAAVFDEKGRVSRLELPSGVIQYNYDSALRATTVIDRKQLTSRFFQNQDGITTRVINALGEETAIDLDGNRNVTSLSRNGTTIERMTYDQQHRLLSRRTLGEPSVVVRNYTYDSATGLLKGIQAIDGNEQSFLYDQKGNLISAGLADGTHKFRFAQEGDLLSFTAPKSTLTFTADPDGLIASMADNQAVTTMAYQAGGELAEAVFPSQLRVRYEYQRSGLRSKLVYKDGRRVEYAYDPAGNLTETKVFDAKGKQVNGQKLEMNNSYQLTRWTLFDGTETTFQYDPNGNLTDIKKGESTIHFEYDELDRLTAVVTPGGQRLTYSYNLGERSVVEQFEHASTMVADVRDTGLTFAAPMASLATRPLSAGFGSVRFSESLGTFQLANADGSEIVRPHEMIEGALTKLHVLAPGLPPKAQQSGFNVPFNTMFVPAEYATINCCPECYFDGDEWYCPPCLPPLLDGIPDHLIVQSDSTIVQNCPSQTVKRTIIYEIVDANDLQVSLVTSQRESFDSISTNTCGNPVTVQTNCTFGFSAFITDVLNVGCNAVGGSCGITLTNQHWFACKGTGDIMVGSPGTIQAQNNIIFVGGTLFFIPGTHIYP